MKKFITIFCAVSILSAANVYAAERSYNNWNNNKYNYYSYNYYLNKLNNSINNNNNNVNNNNVNNNNFVPENNIQSNVSQNNNTNSVQKSMEEQVVELVNVERSKNGLSPLTINKQVSNVAQIKSEDMRDKNYFNHTSPTYGSPFQMLKQFNVSYSYAGENIAKGQKTAQAVVNAWMNSEGHRANILNKNFTQIGVGYATKGSTTYWTQMFIK